MGKGRGQRSRAPSRKPTRGEAARARGRLKTQGRYVQPPMADPTRNLPPHPVRDLGLPDPYRITDEQSWMDDRKQGRLRKGKSKSPRPKGFLRRIMSWLREPFRSSNQRAPAEKVRGWPGRTPFGRPIGSPGSGPSPSSTGSSAGPGGGSGVSTASGVRVGGGGGRVSGGGGAAIATEVLRRGFEKQWERRQAEKRWERVADHEFRRLFSGAKTIEAWRPGLKTPPPQLQRPGLGRSPQASAGRKSSGSMPWEDLPKSWLPGHGPQKSTLRPTATAPRQSLGGPMPWEDLPKSWLPGHGPQKSRLRPTATAPRQPLGPSTPLAGPMPWDQPKSWLPGHGPQMSTLGSAAKPLRSRPAAAASLGPMPWDQPKSWLPGHGPQMSTRLSTRPSAVEPLRSRPAAAPALGPMPWDLPKSWLPGHEPPGHKLSGHELPGRQLHGHTPQSRESGLRRATRPTPQRPPPVPEPMPWDLPMSRAPGHGQQRSMMPPVTPKPPQCRSRPFANQSHPFQGAPHL